MKRIVFAVMAASACLAACSHDHPHQTAKDQQDKPSARPASSAQQAAPAAGDPASESAATTGSTPPPQPAPSPNPSPGGENPAPSNVTPSPAPTAPPAASDVPREPAPKPAPVPEFREVTIPAGTSISVTLLNSLASNASKPEDQVKGALAQPVVVSGLTALPSGSQLSGTVTEVHKAGRVKGKASIAFRFERLLVRGESHAIHTAQVKQDAGSGVKGDVKKGAVGAGAGAIVGGVAGGGTGAAIGALAGGTGAVLATKGKEVELPAGTALTVLLQEPLTVTVPLKKK